MNMDKAQMDELFGVPSEEEYARLDADLQTLMRSGHEPAELRRRAMAVMADALGDKYGPALRCMVRHTAMHMIAQGFGDMLMGMEPGDLGKLADDFRAAGKAAKEAAADMRQARRPKRPDTN